jgi:hypothetical protein
LHIFSGNMERKRIHRMGQLIPEDTCVQLQEKVQQLNTKYCDLFSPSICDDC